MPEAAKKEFPWGIMFGVFLGLILIGTAISIGFPQIGAGIANFFIELYRGRIPMEWAVDFGKHLLAPILVIAIVYLVYRNQKS